jgi:putative addiction module component (TIGR02574 family)
MSATEVVEQFRKLPFEEQHEAFEKIREVVDDFDDALTPEQIAELDRRAEDALKNPGRGTPWEELRDEMLLKYKK